jgi:hypothetical protein
MAILAEKAGHRYFDLVVCRKRQIKRRCIFTAALKPYNTAASRKITRNAKRCRAAIGASVANNSFFSFFRHINSKRWFCKAHFAKSAVFVYTF